jgi:hypothetical protein
MATRSGSVAECYWPGVREEDLRGLDRRIVAAIAELAGDGEPVRYLGWVLIVDDDVVLCLFEGPLGTVRGVAEQAGVPFGRLLRCSRTVSGFEV